MTEVSPAHINRPSQDDYMAQHKLRLSYMPWLYFTLKPKQQAWAHAWQASIQAHWRSLETVIIGKNCFIAPCAMLFAEPGRPIVLGDNCTIGAQAVLHGPITLGDGVSINHHASLDGGRKGIRIGAHSRLAAYSCLYAFNHGMSPHAPIASQAVSSTGINIGQDVWIGAHAGIVDGVSIGDGAIVGMGSIVTRDVASGVKVAGNPARIIGIRD